MLLGERRGKGRESNATKSKTVHERVPTCSLTEARMEEVVSVSDLSPLEAGSTGGTIAPLSCSAGCSGTGIAKINTHKEGV